MLVALLICLGSLVCKSKEQGPTPQSDETCQALDNMIARRSTLILSSCTRNQFCTMISCTGILPTVTSSVTIFPCTSPVHVHFFYSEADMVNQNFTESGRASISPTGSFDIQLEQTKTGIQFGVMFETIFVGSPTTIVIFPVTDIPLHCNFSGQVTLTIASTSIDITHEKGTSKEFTTPQTTGVMEGDNGNDSSMTLIIAIVSSVSISLLLAGATVLAIVVATFHLVKKMKQISTTNSDHIMHDYDYVRPPPLPAPRPPQPQPENQTMEPVPSIDLVMNVAYNEQDNCCIRGESTANAGKETSNAESLVDSVGYIKVN